MKEQTLTTEKLMEKALQDSTQRPEQEKAQVRQALDKAFKVKK